jgi:hypothetical protein
VIAMPMQLQSYIGDRFVGTRVAPVWAEIS